MNLPDHCYPQTSENTISNDIDKEKDKKIVYRVDSIILYIRYKINKIKNCFENVTKNYLFWYLKRIFAMKPFRTIYHFIHGFFYKIKLIIVSNETENILSINEGRLSYPSGSENCTNENEVVIKNICLSSKKMSRKLTTEEIEKRKRKTKYSKELLQELYGSTDSYSLSADSEEQQYLRMTQTDISSTFSEQAMNKIAEMEEEIKRLKRQMEIVCQLKTSQIEMAQNLLNKKLSSSSSDSYILLDETNNSEYLISLPNVYPPTPPPLPSISIDSSTSDSNSNVTNNCSKTLRTKTSGFDNNTLLTELQNIKLKHIEPTMKKKNFGSFLEEALYEKFKNVKLEDYSDSEYSLSDWSD
ncbi:Mitochondrial fission regulator 1 family-containing protein [Strongyloides ratti]|uniref:Mitochondrial fission regulator 1 family-containing protein n=1 Tax=Strongyloides ratti TaxID=34506 RepID=A0A090LIK1_STRRB|nr:Mitochondrial fission regulator 1 family-containing protein [Strongyloides ratti]CEF67315.1 Mitochondrial fission regulator 1 family-containing protein [Strongyloides ratti]